MQGYIVLMVLAVILGTMFDRLHGQKIRFFLQALQQAKATATETLGAVTVAAIATRTLAHDMAS